MSQAKPQTNTPAPLPGAGTLAQAHREGQGKDNKLVFSFEFKRKDSDYVTKYIVTVFNGEGKKILEVVEDSYTNYSYELRRYAAALSGAARMVVAVGREDPEAYDELIKQALRVVALAVLMKKKEELLRMPHKTADLKEIIELELGLKAEEQAKEAQGEQQQ